MSISALLLVLLGSFYIGYAVRGLRDEFAWGDFLKGIGLLTLAWAVR